MERGGDTACSPVRCDKHDDGYQKTGGSPANRDVPHGGVSIMQYLPFIWAAVRVTRGCSTSEG